MYFKEPENSELVKHRFMTVKIVCRMKLRWKDKGGKSSNSNVSRCSCQGSYVEDCSWGGAGLWHKLLPSLERPDPSISSGKKCNIKQKLIGTSGASFLTFSIYYFMEKVFVWI